MSEQELLSNVERCPGCGNVIVREGGKVIGRNFCHPVEVDVTKSGYRYLANTWGYCYTLKRDIKKSEEQYKFN
jgi:hypothetical protein